jgi:hypothetical protein
MLPLTNTPRPSKTESLKDLYDRVNSTNPTGIRAQIKNRNGLMAWGLSKQAGSPHFHCVNWPNNNNIQNEFQHGATQGITRFTGDMQGNTGALGWAKATLRHDNSSYR